PKRADWTSCDNVSNPEQNRACSRVMVLRSRNSRREILLREHRGAYPLAEQSPPKRGKAAKVNRWSPFFLLSTILFADGLPSSPIYSQSYLRGSSPETSDYK